MSQPSLYASTSSDWGTQDSREGHEQNGKAPKLLEPPGHLPRHFANQLGISSSMAELIVGGHSSLHQPSGVL